MSADLPRSRRGLAADSFESHSLHRSLDRSPMEAEKSKRKGITCGTLCAYSAAVGLMTFTVLFAAAAILVPPRLTSFIHRSITKEVVINSPNAPMFDIWQDTRTPQNPTVYIRVYVLNITNPNEILNGAKPVLQQIGPYSYIDNQVKFNISFASDQNSVKFWQWEFLTYDPNTSAAGLDPVNDKVITLSMGYQAIRAIVGVDTFLKIIVELIDYGFNETMFKWSTPHDIVFGGPDKLLNWTITRHALPNLPTSMAIQANQTDMSDGQTPQSFYVQLTGNNDSSLVHQYTTFKGNSTLNVWGSPQANTVAGTDGNIFGASLNQSRDLLVWVNQITRNIRLSWNSTTKFRGIDVFKYDLAPSQLLNVTYEPSNSAYFQFLPNGMFNLSSVFWNAPVFASKAHFLDADPLFLNAVDGLQPNRTLHDSYLEAEPTTGITVGGWRRLMVSSYIEPLKGMYDHIVPTYLPFVWLEEGGEMTDQLAAEMRHKLELAKAVQKYPVIVFGAIAGALAAILVVEVMYVAFGPQSNKDEEREPLLRPSVLCPSANSEVPIA